jgi:hypothetical protein
MTPTLASTSTAWSSLSQPQSSSCPARTANRRMTAPRTGLAPLARYTDARGRPREVITRHGLAGSVLVVDRDAIAHDDCMLVAHLPVDEPPENADLVCRSYLHDVRTRRLRCRGLTAEDAHTPPLQDEAAPPSGDPHQQPPVDCADGAFRLLRVDAGMSIPVLRWCRAEHDASTGIVVVSLREVIAQRESYEPMRTLTMRALAAHEGDGELSTAVLRAELARVLESPIVLNRRLREVMLSTLTLRGMSMSEMAIRCGRVKRDAKGNESGETSWLARRLGLLAESGQAAPTPWIHTDVLALIARCGLGISPREVEVP